MNELFNLTMIRPYAFNLSLAKQKGLALNGSLTLEYAKLSFLYHCYLEQYLIKKLPLKKYDDMLANNNFNIKKVNVSNQSFYQKYSSTGLKFISLRNHAYIEYLTMEDLESLRTGLNFEGYLEPVMKLVERTYKEIIKVRYKNLEDDKTFYVIYEGETPDMAALNSSLVYECDYTIDLMNDEDESWRIKVIESSNRLSQLISSLESEIKTIIDCTVTILEVTK